MKKIVIIEDNKTLSKGIVLSLKDTKYQINKFYNIKDSKEYLNKVSVDLIILDINLPDGSGLDFLQKFRKTQTTPVILLTANDLEIDVVSGLELGANDYITKPFSLAILRARVNNQLREKIENNNFIFDDLKFNFETMEFFRNEVEIILSKTEQKLLKILIDNQGMTLKREVLLEKVWGNTFDYVDNNALSVTIKRLRNKLEENQESYKYIKTVHGIGYTWSMKYE